MGGTHRIAAAVRRAILAGGVCALLLGPGAARADTLDAILDLVLQSVDPSLVDAKKMLKCAIGQGGLNDKTLQVCGGGLAKAKADAYLESDSTAQTVVTVGIAASKKQWGKVIEIGGTKLILDLACTAAMPPGPVKSVLCSNLSTELAKLARPVVAGVVGALSSSPVDVLKLVSILGPGLACKVDVIPAAMRELACGTIGEILAAGKELAEGLADLAASAVKAAGFVFDAGDKALGSYHEKLSPKAYFKAYWVYTTHLGAWLKYVKGEAALMAFVNDRHSSCKQYYGSAKPCDPMRKLYLDTVNPAVEQLKGAGAAYFEVALKPDLLYHYLFYRSSGGKYPGFNWGGNACHLMEKFPLLEGDGLQSTQPRPTVWDHACKKAYDLLLAELAQKKPALEAQLAGLAKQGCTATSSASLYCASYEGQAACLKALPAHASQCVVDVGKATASLAPKIALQLGKRCSVAGQTTVQCTRPWKVDQCKSTVAAYNAQKSAPWGGKLSLACTAAVDPAFEPGKLQALEIAGLLNHKPGGTALMASAANDSGAGCKPLWDPLSLGCKDHKAVAAQLAQLPKLAVPSCPPDPNRDGADLPCIVPVLSADRTLANAQPVAAAVAAAGAAGQAPSSAAAPVSARSAGVPLVRAGSAPSTSAPETGALAAPRTSMSPPREGRDDSASTMGDRGGARSTLPAVQSPMARAQFPAAQVPTARASPPAPTGAPNWSSMNRSAAPAPASAPGVAAPALAAAASAAPDTGIPVASTRPVEAAAQPGKCPPGRVAYTEGTSRVVKCLPAPSCGPGQARNSAGACVCPAGQVAVRRGSEPQTVQCVAAPPCGSDQTRDAETGECRCPPGQQSYRRGSGGPQKCIATKSCPPNVKLDPASGQCLCPPGTVVYWDGAAGGGCAAPQR